MPIPPRVSTASPISQCLHPSPIVTLFNNPNPQLYSTCQGRIQRVCLELILPSWPSFLPPLFPSLTLIPQNCFSAVRHSFLSAWIIFAISFKRGHADAPSLTVLYICIKWAATRTESCPSVYTMEAEIREENSLNFLSVSSPERLRKSTVMASIECL